MKDFIAPDDHARFQDPGAFRDRHPHGLNTDASGWYAAMYKPYHLIGLELGISVLTVALRGEPTGQTREFRGDVAAVSKRAMKTGEMLDGEGGYTVWGKLVPGAKGDGTSVYFRDPDGSLMELISYVRT